MPDDAAIQTVPYRFPKVRGPRMILLHEGRDSSGPLLDQPLFDLAHQRTGNSSPPIAGVNRQPVNVTSPAIEGADDGADDLPIDLGHQEIDFAFGKDSPEVVSVVRDARRGFSLPPEFKNTVRFLRAAVPNE